MYGLKDIVVIIPTYNRSEDVRETLASFEKKIAFLQEVIVVDQSTDGATKQLISNLGNKNIRHVYTPVASLTAARNLGVKRASPKAKIVLFLDDDVTLDKDYFEEIIRVFNEHPNAFGVSGYYLPALTPLSRWETILRMIFSIEHKAPNDARVLSAYGAVYPSKLTKTINSEWLSGFNMAFKREVFDDLLFDENLSRYALGEDFDFSYGVHLTKPGSLYITPYAGLVHRVSTLERTPTKKISYMNQINHFYFNFKHFNRSFREKFTFAWVVIGISLLRTAQFVTRPGTLGALKLKLYFASLSYAITHLGSLRKGNLSVPLT